VLVIYQPIKMGKDERIFVSDAIMQDPVQAALVQLRRTRLLVREQGELGGKADVGQRDLLSDKRFPLRGQSLLEPGGIDCERLLGAGVDRRIDGAV
jgi:hypothetical protein